MSIYQYAVITKQETAQTVTSLDEIDMENVDYKRQPEIDFLVEHIVSQGGFCCGIFRGGMFGLATNQVAIFSAWDNSGSAKQCIAKLENELAYLIDDQCELTATVRPRKPKRIDQDGIYVIRWIRIHARDIDEYTGLCLETWPAFESNHKARCFGVFHVVDAEDPSKLLMLTWYATLKDWEQSRQLNPQDKSKWARRSEMELSHWAEVGRLA